MRWRCEIYSEGTRRGLLPAAAIVATILLLGSGEPGWAGSALPTGGQFVAGGGSIAATGNGLAIGQSTPRAIINWQSFSIGQSNSVEINNGSGATLNRVTGGNLSQIAGSLTATGSAYLVNPQGVVVGPSGRIVTGRSFVASTRDVSNNAFMTGNAAEFQGNSAGNVVNAGHIVAQNGDVILIGQSVTNSGTIAAPNGTAALAASDDILLRPALGDPRVSVKGGTGNVTNSGTIAAAAASLAAADGNVYALAGNTGGIIRATGTRTRDGQVWLVSHGGDVSVSGDIRARNADGSGGQIVARGVDTSVTTGTTLNASARGAGNGGSISIKSHTRDGTGGNTNFSGTATALGAGGGQGGTVETSGRTLAIGGGIVRAGQWLLDPVDLTVDTTAATTIDASLAAGTSVTLTTSATGTSGPGTQSAGAGNITVAAPIAWSTEAALTLSALHDIDINAAISSTGAGTIALRADNTGTGNGTIAFNNGAQVSVGPSGSASFFFNSQDNTNNQAVNPTSYTNPQSYASDVVLAVGATLNQYLLVNTVYDLQNIENNLGQSYALGTNIDATATGSTLNFVPIGSTASPFSGMLNGQGHALNGLNIYSSAAEVGLFGVIGPSGQVENLTLSGATISGSSAADAGALAGTNAGTISNVSTTTTPIPASVGSVTGPGNTGGLVGTNSGTISASSASGITVRSGYSADGGLVGLNAGTISQSFAANVIVGNLPPNNSGTLVGENSGTIENSYATGPTLATSDGVPFMQPTANGGLVGINELGGLILNSYSSAPATIGGLVADNFGQISNSYATGIVENLGYSGNTNAGGFVGVNEASGTIVNSYATGSTTGSAVPNASFVATNLGTISQSYATGPSSYGFAFRNQGTISGSFWDSRATGAPTAVNTGSATGITDVGAAPFSAASYSGFDFANTWVIFEGETRPMLHSEYSTTITNGHQLQLMALNPTAQYTLGGNLDLSETQQASGVWNNANGFVPIGSASAPFTGMLNGAGNTISNLFSLTKGGPGGLFGVIGSTGSVQNLSMVAVQVYGAGSGGSIGALAGINNGQITNASASGAVINAGSTSVVGGLVGTNAGSVTQSSASAMVLGGSNNSVGGLIGTNNGGQISISSASGSVSANGGSTIGGLVGLQTSGSISQSYATGSVSDATGGTGATSAGTSPVALGGLVGQNAGTIDQSWAAGAVTESLGGGSAGGFVGVNSGSINTSYAAGPIVGTGSDALGGLVGGNLAGGSIAQSYAAAQVGAGSGGPTGALIGSNAGALSADYADSSVAGVSGLVGSGPVAGATDVAGAAFSQSSYPGFDFANTWVMLPGATRPLLRSEYSTSIATAQQLQLMTLDPTASYTLANDVNFAATPNLWNPTTGFVPIGSVTTPFTGSLNGQGHVVSNLSINSTSNAVGLFGDIGASGQVSAIGLSNANVTGGSAVVGALAGVNQGTISNAYATGAVTGGNSSTVGGLVGATEGAGSLVSNAYAIVAVTGGTNSTIGGFVGTNTGSILNSYAAGAVSSGPGSTVGGFAGSNSSTGVIGTAAAGDTWYGALTSQSAGIGADANSANTVLSNAATPNSASASTSSGFYFPAGTGASALPILLSEYETTITNSHQLMLLGLAPSATYTLGGSFAWTGPAVSSLHSATDIGPDSLTTSQQTDEFSGTLDGQGYAISGLNTPLFFAIASSGQVRNLSLTDVSLAEPTFIPPPPPYDDSPGEVGVLASANAGTIVNVAASGNFTATNSAIVGGLVGYNEGTIINGTSRLTVNVNPLSVNVNPGGNGSGFVGGLVGLNIGSISGSLASGTVGVTNGGSNAVGGLVGGNSGLILNSAATGNVTNDGFATGGLVGVNNYLIVGSTYGTGAVIGAGEAVGGLVGIENGGTTGAIVSSSSSASVTDNGSNGSVGGLVGAIVSGFVGQPANTGLVVFAAPGNNSGSIVGSGQSAQQAPTKSLCPWFCLGPLPLPAPPGNPLPSNQIGSPPSASPLPARISFGILQPQNADPQIQPPPANLPPNPSSCTDCGNPTPNPSPSPSPSSSPPPAPTPPSNPNSPSQPVNNTPPSSPNSPSQPVDNTPPANPSPSSQPGNTPGSNPSSSPQPSANTSAENPSSPQGQLANTNTNPPLELTPDTTAPLPPAASTQTQPGTPVYDEDGNPLIGPNNTPLTVQTAPPGSGSALVDANGAQVYDANGNPVYVNAPGNPATVQLTANNSLPGAPVQTAQPAPGTPVYNADGTPLIGPNNTPLTVQPAAPGSGSALVDSTGAQVYDANGNPVYVNAPGTPPTVQLTANNSLPGAPVQTAQPAPGTLLYTPTPAPALVDYDVNPMPGSQSIEGAPPLTPDQAWPGIVQTYGQVNTQGSGDTQPDFQLPPVGALPGPIAPLADTTDYSGSVQNGTVSPATNPLPALGISQPGGSATDTGGGTATTNTGNLPGDSGTGAATSPTNATDSSSGSAANANATGSGSSSSGAATSSTGTGDNSGTGVSGLGSNSGPPFGPGSFVFNGDDTPASSGIAVPNTFSGSDTITVPNPIGNPDATTTTITTETVTGQVLNNGATATSTSTSTSSQPGQSPQPGDLYTYQLGNLNPSTGPLQNVGSLVNLGSPTAGSSGPDSAPTTNPPAPTPTPTGPDTPGGAPPPASTAPPSVSTPAPVATDQPASATPAGGGAAGSLTPNLKALTPTLAPVQPALKGQATASDTTPTLKALTPTLGPTTPAIKLQGQVSTASGQGGTSQSAAPAPNPGQQASNNPAPKYLPPQSGGLDLAANLPAMVNGKLYKAGIGVRVLTSLPTAPSRVSQIPPSRSPNAGSTQTPRNIDPGQYVPGRTPQLGMSVPESQKNNRRLLATLERNGWELVPTYAPRGSKTLVIRERQRIPGRGDPLSEEALWNAIPVEKFAAPMAKMLVWAISKTHLGEALTAALAPLGKRLAGIVEQSEQTPGSNCTKVDCAWRVLRDLTGDKRLDRMIDDSITGSGRRISQWEWNFYLKKYFPNSQFINVKDLDEIKEILRNSPNGSEGIVWVEFLDQQSQKLESHVFQAARLGGRPVLIDHQKMHLGGGSHTVEDELKKLKITRFLFMQTR